MEFGKANRRSEFIKRGKIDDRLCHPGRLYNPFQEICGISGLNLRSLSLAQTLLGTDAIISFLTTNAESSLSVSSQECAVDPRFKRISEWKMYETGSTEPEEV